MTDDKEARNADVEMQTRHIEACMHDLDARYRQYLGGDVHDMIHQLENNNAQFRELVYQVGWEAGGRKACGAGGRRACGT